MPSNETQKGPRWTRGGSGVFEHDLRFRSPVSIPRESFAIIRCAQFDLTRRYRNTEIAIHPDSRAAIKVSSDKIQNGVELF